MRKPVQVVEVKNVVSLLCCNLSAIAREEGGHKEGYHSEEEFGVTFNIEEIEGP